jgi:hypothetical protein
MDGNHTPWRAPGAGAEWSVQFCTCSWCKVERWLVRPDPRAPQLWQLAESEGMSPWTVAAATPICPLCGEELAAHREGVGEPEGAVDNPFVTYIRTLKQAA